LARDGGVTLKTVLCAFFASALCAASAAFAQPADPRTPATPAPAGETQARPVLIPTTPGASTGEPAGKPPKPGRRSRLVTVPGGTPESQLTAKHDSDYRFCNITSYELQLSVGIRQSSGFWATRGWWPLPAGECRAVIKGRLSQSSYYTFARSSFAHSGSIRTWGGSQSLCTGKLQFEATSDGTEQCGPGLESQGFAKVETNGKPAWTTTLAESPGFKTLEQARIAGLQRLLLDLGRYPGPVDGAVTPKFSEALAQARTAFSIPLTDDAATLYNKLHAEAMKAQTALGLTFCNRTQDPVWAALARETQGKKLSQGWWHLQPGQCEKVIRDRLEERLIYAFAEHSGESKAQPWKGNFNFCTRPQIFEIEGAEDCEGRGFKKTGFLQIDTGGQPGVTFEFRKEEAPAQGQ
jgi:uncharacterized membrane protein